LGIFKELQKEKGEGERPVFMLRKVGEWTKGERGAWLGFE
jgi:hypothetical protein